MKNDVWSDKEQSEIRNEDRILPSQPYFTKMYKGGDFYGDLQRLMFSMLPEPEFIIEEKPGLSYACMGSEINTLRFYQFLIRMNGYKSVLELGTYIGVSAMYMAESGAHVTTVEKGEEFYKIAEANIFNNGFIDKIRFHCDDAVLFMQRDMSFYDMILIDCAKESYRGLLQLSMQRLSANGLILVDDVFFQGDTLNEFQTTEKGFGVSAMLDYAATLYNWEKVILPIGNGLLMMRRK